MKLTQRSVAPRSKYDGPWGAGTKVPGMSDPMVASGPVTKRYDKPIYLEADPVKRHELARKFQGVLRMQVRKQPIQSGGVRGPSMIVHGQKGPTSRRQSKGVHKKSGSASGNLCHLVGRTATHVPKLLENNAKSELFDRLKIRHAHLVWLHKHKPQHNSLVMLTATYQHLVNALVKHHPECESQVAKMEHAHWSCMQ